MKNFRLTSLLLFWTFQSWGQWQVQPSATEAHFRSVVAVNERVVWAGGSKGTILRTLNGGAEWQVIQITGAETLDFRGIHAFDERTAVAMSAGPSEDGKARIYRTTNGGQSWQLVWHTDQKGVFMDGIGFWDKKNGLIFGDPINGKWFLLRTSDGGVTWQPFQPDQLPPNLPNEAAFAASNGSMALQGKTNVWIGTGGSTHARIFFSGDRGAHWQVYDTPLVANASSGIFGVRFWEAQKGVIVGGDYKAEKAFSENIAFTTDGGKTWQKASPALPDGLKESIWRFGGGKGLVVGPSGSSISKDGGHTWQIIENTPPGLHALSCAGRTCYAVGAKGVVGKIVVDK